MQYLFLAPLKTNHYIREEDPRALVFQIDLIHPRNAIPLGIRPLKRPATLKSPNWPESQVLGDAPPPFQKLTSNKSSERFTSELGDLLRARHRTHSEFYLRARGVTPWLGAQTLALQDSIPVTSFPTPSIPVTSFPTPSIPVTSFPTPSIPVTSFRLRTFL